MGVAVGNNFTLAVTDAGAVFSFGFNENGVLGHGSLVSREVLPQRIEALAQTGQRFVAVAAGGDQALALAEGGQLYGWGADPLTAMGSARTTVSLSQSWWPRWLASRSCWCTQTKHLRAPSRRRVGSTPGAA